MNRREFLCATTVAAAGLAALPGSERGDSAAADKLIDVNVSLSRWPGRRLPLDDTAALVAKLKEQKVEQAWTGSFDGIFHKDVGAANSRLVEDCKRHGRGILTPVGTVNPHSPDWEEEIRKCRREHGMMGVRLFPGYHGYKLADAEFARLMAASVQLGMIVQLVVAIEDERMMHPLLHGTAPDLVPLIDQLKAFPAARVVLLNWFRSAKGPLLTRLAQAGNVYFDVATVEGVGGVADLFKLVPAGRVLFGSHAPFFYFESAKLKLQESVLSPEQLAAVSHGSAEHLTDMSKI